MRWRGKEKPLARFVGRSKTKIEMAAEILLCFRSTSQRMISWLGLGIQALAGSPLQARRKQPEDWFRLGSTPAPSARGNPRWMKEEMKGTVLKKEDFRIK